MSCLVLGGGGFVGTAVVEAAQRAGWAVTSTGHREYGRHVGRTFDVIVNANGNASRVRAGREPLFDFDASVRSVFRSLFDFQCGLYVLVSTVDVLNDVSGRADTSETAAIDPTKLGPYGFNKRMAELCVMRYAPSWQVFRLASMVGPGLVKGPVFDLLAGQPLWISPDSRMPFLDVGTAADVLLRLIGSAPAGEVFNVCGRGSVGLRRIIGLLGPEAGEVRYADRAVQTYRIDVSRTHAIVPLPRSWDQVRAYVQRSRDPGAA